MTEEKLDLTIVKAKPLQTNRVVSIKLEELKSILGVIRNEEIGLLRHPALACIEYQTIEGRQYRKLAEDEIYFILSEGFGEEK